VRLGCGACGHRFPFQKNRLATSNSRLLMVIFEDVSMSKGFWCWLSVIMALLPVSAHADTARGQFAVSVNVLAECRITMPAAPRPVTQGLHTPSVIVDAVDLHCSKNTAYQLSFRPALNSDSAIRPERISGLGNGATQTVRIEHNTSKSVDNKDGSQPELLVMTIDY
jgi:hypothetical protein